MIKPTRVTVLFAGICALILSMGIARYALTPMLPVMQAQLGIDEAMAGRLAGLTYAGYLFGLFIVWLMGNLQIKDFFYRYGITVAIVATAYIGASDVEVVWYAARFFAGVCGATGFMLGTGLVMNWMYHNNHKPNLGILFSGMGIAIVVSALVVDMMNTSSLTGLDWRIQWVVLAAVGAVFFVPAYLLIPKPSEHQVDYAQRSTVPNDHLPSKKWLLMATIAYFCAGMSTTVNVTFNAWITEMRPDMAGWGTKIWLVVGLAAIPAPIIWEKIADRINSINALIICFIIAVIANLLLAQFESFMPTVIAAILFGFSFMGIVSLMLSAVAHRYGHKATQIMAQLTLMYCISQVLSPIIAGIIAEGKGSFAVPLYIVSGFLIAGILCLLSISKEHKELRALD